MKNNDTRYKAAIVQNLYDLERVVSYRNACVELSKTKPQFILSFFSNALRATYDLMIFHLLKTLDEHKDAASFWYLENCNPTLLKKLCKKHNLNLEEIKLLSKRLKDIRDKSFVHNDKTQILEPSEVWNNAKVDVNTFNDAIDKLWKVLNDLHKELLKHKFIIPPYRGEDIADIVKIVRENGIEI